MGGEFLACTELLDGFILKLLGELAELVFDIVALPTLDRLGGQLLKPSFDLFVALLLILLG